MYATKPLSVFRSHPEAASLPPPEGAGSGYLVVKSADDGADETRCWGNCGGTRVRGLPFPQNRVITVLTDPAGGEYAETYAEAVVFVPVPGLPLSSNRYYAVLARGKDRGLVRACSREEDVKTRCFCRCVRDAKPRPFDPDDLYQQMEIVPNHKGGFTARAVADDGHPYFLYRSKYWLAYASKPKNFDLGEALGLNDPLRLRQLQAQSLTLPAAAGAVGRWYCPFFFIKEDGVPLKKQMDRATFYEVVLEQRWEAVGAVQATKRVLVGGSVEGKQESVSLRHGDKYVWFTAAAWPAGQRVGVSARLWERMRWEEHRAGWTDEGEDAGKKMAAGGGSVLVERFVLKRMDGNVAVAFDFVHLSKVEGFANLSPDVIGT